MEGEDGAHLNAHTHIDVNVNTDNSHTRISVTTGQVRCTRLCALPLVPWCCDFSSSALVLSAVAPRSSPLLCSWQGRWRGF